MNINKNMNLETRSWKHVIGIAKLLIMHVILA